MDLRSGRRLGSRPPLQQHGPSHRRDPGGADRISFLSDDMILLILVRVHCVRTAVRTGILSRRWRNLWTRLTNLAFRDVGRATIEAAFCRFKAASPAGTEFHLDICLSSRPQAADANSLLRAAASFSPAGLVFSIASYFLYPRKHGINLTIKLPCFQHATSIELDTQQFKVMPPAAGEFTALERLSISGTIFYIGDLVTRCPRLHYLRAKPRGHGYDTYELLKQELGSLKDALGSREVAVSLDIHIGEADSLFLCKAADLSPQELAYTNTHTYGYTTLDLPCFNRATSIEINMPGISFRRPLHGELSALERLCLSCCNIDNVGEFVSCCPRLRVLRVDGSTSGCHITVHSKSLQELALGTYKDCCGINIVTPKLKQLTMEVHAGGELGTSVLAPLMEKIAWRRSYKSPAAVFGFWILQSLSLETVASTGERVLEDDAWLSVQQPPRTHVLSMDMCASSRPSDASINFAREIEKLSVTKFSVLGISLEAMGHVYGATLFHFLQALTLHGVTKILKVNLVRSKKSKVTQGCIENCFCDEPKNWRNQSISLPHLEEAEIHDFKGENHGFDFLKLIFRSSPNIKKVTIKVGKKIESFAPGGCAKEIYNISSAYPSANLYVYFSCGRLVPRS